MNDIRPCSIGSTLSLANHWIPSSHDRRPETTAAVAQLVPHISLHSRIDYKVYGYYPSNVAVTSWTWGLVVRTKDAENGRHGNGWVEKGRKGCGNGEEKVGNWKVPRYISAGTSSSEATTKTPGSAILDPGMKLQISRFLDCQIWARTMVQSIQPTRRRASEASAARPDPGRTRENRNTIEHYSAVHPRSRCPLA